MQKAKKRKVNSSQKTSQKTSQKKFQTTSQLTKAIREEVWPSERKVLFNPERLRYVRKLVKPKGCVFCHAVKKGPGEKSLLLFKGKDAIVVLNKYPYNNGHTLVLPRRHCGDFLDLSVKEQREINACLKQVVHALTELYKPSGFNIGLNLGSAAGAGIPEHLHYHVIPRWWGDTNFFPLIAKTKVVVETVEQTFAQMAPYFEDFLG